MAKMKRRGLTLAAIVLSSAVLATRAAAQNTYALGIGGGATIPVGHLSNTQTRGFNGMLSLAIGAAELPIGFRLDGIYNNFSRKDITSAQAGQSNTYSFRIDGLLGNFVYAFPGTTAKIYVVTGAGWYNTRLDVAGTKSENHYGLNAGLGTTFGLGPITGFVESRYHFISRQPDKGGVIHFVPVTLGLLF